MHLDAYDKDGRGDRLELYHLELDPAETENLLEAYPQRAKAMQEWYEKKAREIGVVPFDSLILANSM